MLTDIADRTWLWGAAGFYLAGFLLGTYRCWPTGKPRRPHEHLIAVGLRCSFIGLGVRGKAVGGCRSGNTFEIFSVSPPGPRSRSTS